jgi:low affinity Fe/Cu permease
VLAAVAIVAVLGIVTLNGVKLALRAVRSTPSANDTSFARLDERVARLEQSVDVIAVEMERIGEGQRFLTRILTESQTRQS